jgi:sulfate/thiosulfate transport system permease protein
MTTAVLGQDTRAVGRGRPGVRFTLTRGSGLALGIGMTWFSLLVLIPLAAIVVAAGKDGWHGYVDTLTNRQSWAAIKLTVGQSLLVTGINVVMGTLIAWVLVRDRFWGKRLLDLVIDIPFAMPTIVAGLVLLGLYGPKSPLGINVSNGRASVTLALAFVTLPFIVRTVQPVLAELDTDVEEAAASLGASQRTILRRIVLPSIVPAIAAGAALSFARAISEYGSLVLISGMLPYKTEVVSVRVLSFIEGGDRTSAAALATIMLAVALVVIVALDVLQRRMARRG